ncbi:MAG TPA: hypothetical protein VFI95_12115 [Terriglobales bacterium]|nr:hypothetical protein [Terriglobales bacterium]
MPILRRIAEVHEIWGISLRYAAAMPVNCNAILPFSASPLGRTESHVLNAVQTIDRVLNALLGTTGSLPSPEEPALEIGEGNELLEANTEALLGPASQGRKVRIMVTISSDAATDYDLVRDLVRNGMDCTRINCAHVTLNDGRIIVHATCSLRAEGSDWKAFVILR